MVLEQHLSVGIMQNLSVVNSLAEESAQFLETNSQQDSGQSYGDGAQHRHMPLYSGHHQPRGPFEHFVRAETASVNYSDDCTLSADPTDTLSTLGHLELGARYGGMHSWKSHPMGIHRAQMLANAQRHGLAYEGSRTLYGINGTQYPSNKTPKPLTIHRPMMPTVPLLLKKQAQHSVATLDRDAALRSRLRL